MFLNELVKEISQGLLERQLKVAAAESCTGGGVAYWLTSLSGSSDWFERGFVTYSNAAKEEMLGVRSATLKTFGAVSEETAREMAAGALKNSAAQCSVAITGIAGPLGGSAEKPVGTVWFAWGFPTETILAERRLFSGDRGEIREQAIRVALEGLRSFP